MCTVLTFSRCRVERGVRGMSWSIARFPPILEAGVHFLCDAEVRQQYSSASLFQHSSGSSSCVSSSGAEATDVLLSFNEVWRKMVEEKHAMTMNYTQQAETAVDDFLHRHYEFSKEAIPWDYLEVPPADLDVVTRNRNTLLHVVAEVFFPQSLVMRVLISPFVNRVWREHLLPLRRRLMLFREEVLDSLSVQHNDLHQVAASVDAARGQKNLPLGDLLRDIDKDLLYLAQIERREQGLQRHDNQTSEDDELARAEQHKEALSDFVTVAGAVIGRLHRLENEHRTVLEHWGGVKPHTKT